VSSHALPLAGMELEPSDPHGEPVRVAVVGLGYWGPNLARNLFELPAAEVVTLCDASQEKLNRISARYPSLPTGTDFAEVLNSDVVEAVVIATPVHTHYSLAMAALEAGKHVFIEKPMAASVADAERLAAAAGKRSLVLMPGHTFLYSPPVNLIRSLIDSGVLGSILYVSMSRVNLGLHQSDVSVVWDLGPHDFSILQFLLGRTPTSVSAMTRDCVVAGVPDVAFINAQYSTGTIAHIELSWLAPSKLRRTTLIGSRQMIVYDDSSREPVRVFDSGVELPEPTSFGEYRLTYRSGSITSPPVPVTEPVALEMADFCRCIRTGGTPVSSSAVGIDVLRVVEAVDRSLQQGGQRVIVGS
jgi:predicted dehydrogenase